MSFKIRFTSLFLYLGIGASYLNVLLAQTTISKKPTHPDWIYREWPNDPSFLSLVAVVS